MLSLAAPPSRRKGIIMKIVFTKDDLLANLTPVMGTVTTKNTITSLEGVLIETLGGNTVRFSTYDMNKGTRTTFEATEVIEEGSYIINAQRFMQFVRVMNDGEITLEVDQKFTVHISSGNASFTMYATAGADFPTLPELSGDRGFSVSGEVLKDMIARVSHSIAENDSRPSLCGAYFTIEGNVMQVVSCDSYTLSRCSVTCDITGIGESGATTFSFILPGHALGEMNKILSERKGDVRIVLARKHAILHVEGLLFFTRLIDGAYFDYERIIPHDQSIFVTCDKDRLVSCLDRALLIAEEKMQSRDKSYVKLDLCGNMIHITSSSYSGRVYDEMPCSHEGEDLTIAFNCRYLLNSIRAADTDTLKLSFRSASQAVTIEAAEPKEDKSFFYLLLPVRMND